MPSPAPERVFGHYELVTLLGSGGMGDVYLAIDTRLQRKAAIKLIRTAHDDDEQAAARFLREARTIAALDHPNICTLYEFGHVEGREFLAMQYIEGESLAARLQRGTVPLDEALRLGIELTSALAYAHSRSVLHRDLKPQNVMLQTDGRVKLLDFGLAKLTPADAHALTNAATEAELTRRGVVIGTTQYMSPEQLSGRPVDARSDIFSLGLVFYELLAGLHPFRRETAALTMSAILTTAPPRLTKLPPDRDALLNLIVSKTLARNPEERYSSAHDLLVDLKRAARDDGGAPGAVPRVGRRSIVAAAGLLLLLAISAIVTTMFRDQPPGASITPTVVEHSLTYWLEVRGENATQVAPMSPDDPLPPGARMRVNVTASNPGYLYLVNEDSNVESGLALVYPLGTDAIHAALGVTTDWYAFAPTGAEERIWIVWAEAPVTQLEQLRPLVNARDLGKILEPGRRRALHDWLRSSTARDVRETRNVERRDVTVSYSGTSAVRQIRLRQRGKVSS
jgi:serine/threonine protein kinase